MEWIEENEVTTMVEEGEDILDGLETMLGEPGRGVTEDILKDATEIITSIILAEQMAKNKIAPIFLRAGKSRKVGRVEGMERMREELRRTKNLRIKPNSRDYRTSDFEDIEVKEVKRKEASKRMDSGVLRSDQVANRYVQDKGQRIKIIGSDVESLYPSLEAVEVAEIVYNAMIETEVSFDNINWTEGSKYITLTSTEQECRMGPLKRVLPKRRYVNGTRPGITGEDPMSREQNSQDQWEFRNLPNGLTKQEKRLVVAKVMKTAVLAIFKTHTYSFNQKFYLQARGGPIGLRSTCAIARLVMMWWDDELLEAIERLNIKTVAGARYMDDIRLWLHAIRLGWRLVEGELVYKREWRLEEEGIGVTSLEKTTQILKDIMNSICGWLTLTMETEDMFGGVLPTLDLELWVRADNKVLFKYFEKAMVPDMVLHKRSAIPESTRRATLNQELIRRMVNTSEMVGMSMRLEIVDKYAKKLINSEYSVEYTRSAIVGGLKGYERLLSLSRDVKNPKWKPLHMPAKWNARNRRIAKMGAKTNWYKGKKEVEPPAATNKDDESVSSPKEDLSQRKQSQKAGRKGKRRGKNRGTVTLGGLKKIEKARKRKTRQKLRKRLGDLMDESQEDGKLKGRQRRPPPPTRSVLFVDSSAN